jgi:hypothetical protein
MPSNFESMSIKEKTNAFNKFTIDERLRHNGRVVLCDSMQFLTM